METESASVILRAGAWQGFAGILATGHGVSAGGDANVPTLAVTVVTQLCEIPQLQK